VDRFMRGKRVELHQQISSITSTHYPAASCSMGAFDPITTYEKGTYIGEHLPGPKRHQR
jgi:hypothetical protein